MNDLSPSMEQFRNDYFSTSIKNAFKMMKARKELERIKTAKNKVKSIYASVVQDATNSALARLVELDGKQYIAQHLAAESPNVKLKQSTLSQKLGLEERYRDGENNNVAFNIENVVVQKMPRLAKGSQEAKDFMARIRALRKGGRRTKTQISQANLIKRANFMKPRVYKGRTPKSLALTSVSPVAMSAPKRRGRPPKIQQTYASVLAAPAPKRRGRPPKMSAPAPTVIPSSAAPIYSANAKRRVGRPRKIVSKSASEIASLLNRARFGLARRYQGGRRK